MCDWEGADGLSDAQRDYVAAVVAAAPPLSDDVIDQLRALLPPPSAGDAKGRTLLAPTTQEAIEPLHYTQLDRP